MKFSQVFHLSWKAPGEENYSTEVPARVPGNAQYDYAQANGLKDFAFADSCKNFVPTEEYTWRYRADLDFESQPGERVYLVAKGIDYQFTVSVAGKLLHSQEGMYTPVELDITDLGKPGDMLEIEIAPRPYREGALPNRDGIRDAADQCCKPPVTYGWDWNPRLITSGIWQELYIETRKADHIESCEAFYTLSDDMRTAQVRFETACRGNVTYKLYDPQGNSIYCGSEPVCTVENVQLWWCNGQGAPALYRWEAEGGSNCVSGRIGFKRLRIVRNTDVYAPLGYPKTRDPAPITLELNGRRIFAKGSNFVNTELFFGHMEKAGYAAQVKAAKEAHMNILRCWGGAGIQKADFYDLCDENGILVWQEFMLACNNYVGTPHYLRILEQEARSVIRQLRSHACLAFWCGGNELFNRWSGMDDQSHALRLLNKLCYELDFERPFLATAPLFGMAHGGYRFRTANQDVFQMFQNSACTAYSEFGVAAMADVETLKTIIPAQELFPVENTPAWRYHFGVGLGEDNGYVSEPILRHYFGKAESLAELVFQSNWLQCEGYKAIFEESRRQWPQCSMALNWCFNEPWVCAANCSILMYPAKPKPGYYAVQAALRPAMPSARVPKFDWKGNENFTAQIWYHNDGVEAVSDRVKIRVELGTDVYELLTWETGILEAGTNKLGPAINLKLPLEAESKELRLILESQNGNSSSYTLLFRNGTKPVQTFELNQ